jgi:hypothetical protein
MGKVSPQRKRVVAKRPPSPADEAEARALDRAVQTMIDGPLSDWVHTRPLGSLNRDDLRKLAIAAIIGWVLQRSVEGCDPGEADQNSNVFFVG